MDNESILDQKEHVEEEKEEISSDISRRHQISISQVEYEGGGCNDESHVSEHQFDNRNDITESPLNSLDPNSTKLLETRASLATSVESSSYVQLHEGDYPSTTNTNKQQTSTLWNAVQRRHSVEEDGSDDDSTAMNEHYDTGTIGRSIGNVENIELRASDNKLLRLSPTATPHRRLKNSPDHEGDDLQTETSKSQIPSALPAQKIQDNLELMNSKSTSYLVQTPRKVKQDDIMTLEDLKASFVSENKEEWVSYVTDSGDPYLYNPVSQETKWARVTESQNIQDNVTIVENRKTSQAPTGKSEIEEIRVEDIFAAAEGDGHAIYKLEALVSSHVRPPLDIDTPNHEGLTSLIVAVANHCSKAVHLLLALGASPNVGVVSTGDKPLIIACRTNQMEVAKALIDYGAALDVVDQSGNTLLHVSLKTGLDCNLFFYILENIVDVSILNAQDEEEQTIMHIAARIGADDILRQLIYKGASSDIEDIYGRTPFVVSVLENHVECVQVLQSVFNTHEQGSISVPSTPSKPKVQYTQNRTPISVPPDTFSFIDADPNGQKQNNHAVNSISNIGNAQLSLDKFTKSVDPSEHAAVDSFIGSLQDQIGTLTHELLQKTTQIENLNQERQNLVSQGLLQSQELEKAHQEILWLKNHIETRDLEFESTRIALKALVDRCGNLENVARLAQEKLKRDREEHSRYVQELQTFHEKQVQENSQLCSQIQQLQQMWQYQSQHLHTRQPYEKQISSDLYSKSNIAMPDDKISSLASTHVQQANLRKYPTSTNESANRATILQHYSSEQQMSPSRIDAVWSKFFENMSLEVQAKNYSNNKSDTITLIQSPRKRAPIVSDESLFETIRQFDTHKLQVLLRSGLSPSQRNLSETGTPLHLACELGNIEAVMALHDCMMHVDVRDERANTPLLIAAKNGQFECVKFLVQSAASLVTQNMDGNTALHLAAMEAHIECVQILLEYGADVHIQNYDGLSVIEAARTRLSSHQVSEMDENHPLLLTIAILDSDELHHEYDGEDTLQSNMPLISTKSDNIPPVSERIDSEVSELGYNGSDDDLGEDTNTDDIPAEKPTWTQWLFGYPRNRPNNGDKKYEGSPKEKQHEHNRIPLSTQHRQDLYSGSNANNNAEDNLTIDEDEKTFFDAKDDNLDDESTGLNEKFNTWQPLNNTPYDRRNSNRSQSLTSLRSRYVDTFNA